MAIQSAFTLNPNEIFASLANMIISQEVFADNLGKHQTLVDKARVDGGLYGDKKLYYATDVLESHAWGADAEAANLLALDRPQDPEVQEITLNVFRQIRLTVDNYLTKKAWSTEGAFSSFNSVMLGWMRETKRVYDGTLYNVFIGTNESSIGAQKQTVASKSAATPELEAKVIAEKIANIGSVSLESSKAVGKARKAYDKLTPEQALLVGNYDDLLKAEKKLNPIHLKAGIPISTTLSVPENRPISCSGRNMKQTKPTVMKHTQIFRQSSVSSLHLPYSFLAKL